MQIRALSVKQPWANFIADGCKTIETRTWGTGHKGPLLIVSSKRPDRENFPELVASDNGPYGCAVAVARLMGCRPMTREDEAKALCKRYPGAIAWILTDIKKIKKPFPVTGQMGLYSADLPAGVL